MESFFFPSVPLNRYHIINTSNELDRNLASIYPIEIYIHVQIVHISCGAADIKKCGEAKDFRFSFLFFRPVIVRQDMARVVYLLGSSADQQ